MRRDDFGAIIKVGLLQGTPRRITKHATAECRTSIDRLNIR